MSKNDLLMKNVKIWSTPLPSTTEYGNEHNEPHYEGVIIKNLIRTDKIEAKEQSISFMSTRSGRIACACLLGLYDGDGSYIGGNQGRLYSSNIQLLTEIKENFEIANIIFLQRTVYALNLGPEVFSSMIDSYKFSMERKRPKHDRNE
jgi:hypothetical protein